MCNVLLCYVMLCYVMLCYVLNVYIYIYMHIDMYSHMCAYAIYMILYICTQVSTIFDGCGQWFHVFHATMGRCVPCNNGTVMIIIIFVLKCVASSHLKCCGDESLPVYQLIGV